MSHGKASGRVDRTRDPHRLRVRVHAPAADVLAGRVLETVRTALPGVEPTLTTGRSAWPPRPAGTAGDAPTVVSVPVVGVDTPGTVLRGDGPTLALVLPDGTAPEGVPAVAIDPDAPAPALDALREWLEAVADGRGGEGDPGNDGLGTLAGAAVLGGLAGLIAGGLLGEGGEPPVGGEFL